MSEKESKQETARLEPTEELSLHIKLNKDHEDEINVHLENYPNEAVIVGKDKFFRIVTFQSTEERDNAMDKITEKFKDKLIKVSKYHKSVRRTRMEESKRKVYVSGFDSEVTKEQLESKFGEYGKIEELILLKSKAKENLPFAFVKYSNKESAENAVKSEKVTLDGNELLVEISRFKNPPYPTRANASSVMISNLPNNFTKDKVHETIKEFGDYISIICAQQYAIVKYRSPKLAQNLIKILNGKNIDGKDLVVFNTPKNISNNYNNVRGNKRFGGRRRFRGGSRRRGGERNKRTDDVQVVNQD